MTATVPQARYALVLFTLTYMSSYIDRVIVGVLGQSIKTDLGLQDWQLGVLTGLAFVIFYATLGVPIAALSDRIARARVLSGSLAVWSAMTCLCGMAANFWQLAAARLGVGVGEAGCTPAAHSMICDLYPPQRRGAALSVYALGVPLGILFGAIAGGWLGQTIGWRWGLVALGAPGLALALLMWLTLKEPVRARFDAQAADDAPPLLQAMAAFLRDPVFVQVTLGVATATAAGVGFGAFAVPLLLRGFDISLFTAATTFGLSWGVAGILGALVGGPLIDFLGGRRAYWYALTPALLYLASLPFFLLALYSDTLTEFAAMTFMTACLSYMATAPSMAVLHNRATARTRAAASAMLLFATSIFGLSVGPTLAGYLSDQFAEAAFTGGGFGAACAGAAATTDAACRAASHGGLRQAMSVLALFLVWGAAHYLIAAWKLRREDR